MRRGDTRVWYSTQPSRMVPGPKVCKSDSTPTARPLPFSETLRCPRTIQGPRSHFPTSRASPCLPTSTSGRLAPPSCFRSLVEQSHPAQGGFQPPDRGPWGRRDGGVQRSYWSKWGAQRIDRHNKQGTSSLRTAAVFEETPEQGQRQERKEKCLHLILDCHPSLGLLLF